MPDLTALDPVTILPNDWVEVRIKPMADRRDIRSLTRTLREKAEGLKWAGVRRYPRRTRPPGSSPNTTQSIGRLRGRFHQYRGIPVLCTYHPAYLFLVA